MFDDASYNTDAIVTAGPGSVTYSSPNLTWTGNLAVAAVATITFSVTVSSPDTGSHLLASTVTSATPGNNCPAGSTDPRCTTTVPVSDLVIDCAVSASTVTPGAGSTDPRCGVTVPVLAGALSMTAPISANLGATAPGGSASASLGTVQVIDSRGFGAGWTATVSSTGFTTGNGTAPETIPASDAYYDITGFGSITGSATFSTAPQTILSGTPQAVVSATNVGGTMSATWDPLIGVNVPPAAIAGQYTTTIVHSVS